MKKLAATLLNTQAGKKSTCWPLALDNCSMAAARLPGLPSECVPRAATWSEPMMIASGNWPLMTFAWFGKRSHSAWVVSWGVRVRLSPGETVVKNSNRRASRALR